MSPRATSAANIENIDKEGNAVRRHFDAPEGRARKASGRVAPLGDILDIPLRIAPCQNPYGAR